MTKLNLSTTLRNALLLLGTGIAVSTSGYALDLDRDLVGVTCNEYMAALAVADPGKSPSEERQKEAHAAQDDIASAMLWLHGYLTGRDHTMVPLDRDWMVAHVGKLAKSCQTNSPDGHMRLADAAAKL